MRFLTIMLAIVTLPSWGAAQTTAPLPAHDVTFSAGWSGAEYDAIGDYDRWRGSLLVGVSGGRYWTEHFKSEIEAAWNSRTNSEIYEDLAVGAARTYGLANYRVEDLRFSFGQSYQFGRNQWVHPFLGVGADVVRRQTFLDRPRQTRPTYGGVNQRPIDVVVPARQETETRMLVRPFVKGGWKMYASDRVYFSTELKFGFAPDLDHALWKLGMGFDF